MPVNNNVSLKKNMLTKLLSKITSYRSTKKRNRFELLMERANELANHKNVYGLIDLTKIVLRPIQAEHIRNAYLREPDAAIEELFYSDLGLNCILPEFDQTFDALLYTDLCRVSDSTKFPKLNLASDVTFPTSWNPSSIVNVLGIIGQGRHCGPFVQSENHQVMYTYPLAIGWVANGNHSLIQAILRGEGEIQPTEVYDLSQIIKSVKFDGEQWLCRKTNAVLGVPRYPEFGWVWEIGRLIVDLEDNPFQG
jgi:hypothetical protein